jgi:ATP-binding cassette subfamily B protein
LKDVSFHVESGNSLAIVGRTGAGKSTIAALICRLYDIDSGTISIDGESIQELNLDDLRSAVGYVPQEVFLFSETITNNIAFGLKNAKTDSLTFDKVTHAAKDAAIFDSIMEFPNGFETKVGERGLTLSGGQKQRISIARAIIRKPAILLFDDCLSAVDTETENQILDNLKKVSKDKVFRERFLWGGIQSSQKKR